VAARRIGAGRKRIGISNGINENSDFHKWYGELESTIRFGYRNAALKPYSNSRKDFLEHVEAHESARNPEPAEHA
jgi:hypothetical protein